MDRKTKGEDDELKKAFFQSVPGLVAAMQRDDVAGFSCLVDFLIADGEKHGKTTCEMGWYLFGVMSSYAAFLLEWLSHEMGEHPAEMSMRVSWGAPDAS